jgi:hypothetical protein
MTDLNEKSRNFLGTYFDRDDVLRLSRWAEVAAWVVLTIYLLSWLLSVVMFFAQLANGLFFDKGMTFLGVFSIFKPYLVEPIPGILSFFGLQAISKVLLVLLDVEDNSRRAARKNAAVAKNV